MNHMEKRFSLVSKLNALYFIFLSCVFGVRNVMNLFFYICRFEAWKKS